MVLSLQIEIDRDGGLAAQRTVERRTSCKDQIFTAKSMPADANRLALDRLQARLSISVAWPLSPENTAIVRPDATFHRRMDSSADAERSRSS